MTRLLLVVLACLPTLAHAVQPANRYPLAEVRVHDGDTITADVILGWGVTLNDARIRCADFDAWEISARRKTVEVTSAEIAKGQQAADYLRALVKTHRLYLEPADRERDVYGRILGVVLLVDREGREAHLAELMERGGHCRQ